MKKSDLEMKLAKLQSQKDLMETEIQSVDQLLRAVGFAGGLETLKAAAEEAIGEGYV